MPKDLFALIERHQPGDLFCAFDLPEKTFRSEIDGDFYTLPCHDLVIFEGLKSQAH